MSEDTSKDTSRPSALTADTEKKKGGVPWSPWLGVLFAVLVYYVSQAAAGFFLSIYPALKHWSHSTTLDWVDNSAWAQFTFVVLAEAFTIAAVYFFLKRYKAGFPSIGLKRPRWSDPLYGLLAIPAYFILYLLAVSIISHFVPALNIDQKQEIGFNGIHGGLPLAMAFISLVVLPAFTEEVMVRGFLYSSMKKAMPTVYAVIFTSALFASAHLPEGGSAGPLYIAALDTFILSLVLIYLREQTGSLWASITLHAAKNTIAFISLFALHLR